MKATELRIGNLGYDVKNGRDVFVTGIDSSWDEVWLYAVNSDTTARKLTIEWGEATAPDGNIELTIPAESGLVLVVPGLFIQNELVVKAFCAVANVVMIHGYVNRIT